MASDDVDIDDISPHIRIRIKPQKKKEWLEYANEYHEGNLTALIKESVDNTLSDTWVLEDQQQPEMDLDTSGLEDGVEEINDRLSVVERQLNELSLHSSDDTESDLSRDDLIKLANRCHDLLPRLQSEIQFPSLQKSLSVEIEDLSDELEREVQSETIDNPIRSIRAKITGRAEDIGDALEEPVHHVRQALIFLEETETGSHVQSTIDDGARRWFIQDPDANPNFDFLNDSQREVGE